MGALDQVRSYFTGDVKIDDPEIRQALKDAFPNLAKSGSEFDDLEYLPSSYIQEKIVPALMIMDEAHLQTFKSSIEKTSTDLHSLAKDVESSLKYKPRDGNALPSNEQIPDRLKSSAKGVFKEAQNFLAEIANLRTDAEKEQALMAEIIASANRSVVKFDRYVQRGDGIQYGDRANDWFERDSKNVNLRRPDTTKNIRHNVENVPKIDFVTVVNEVVAMAQDASVNVNVDGKAQPVGSGTRIEKLAYLASWMSALEEGTDKVLPNMLAEAATNTAVTAVNGVAGTVGDTASGLFDEYPVITTAGIALAVYASYKAGKGILSLGSIPFKGMAWAAGKFSATRGLVPGLSGVGSFLDNFGRNGSTTSAGAPGAAPEGPKTPRRFTAASPDELKDFKPGEANHQEYYKKTLEHIKGLSTAATPVNANEVNKRTSQFMRLDEEYRRGKMSLSEYLKRTEDIITGKGRIVVVDHSGVIDKAATQKNVIQRVADRTPGVSQFTRNLPEGSATASVNAIQKAKSRIKGTSYESVDFAGQKIEFADTTAKSLFEGFRDKLERYTQMQEWDATNREIIAKEGLITKIQNTDIPATQRDITAKAGVIAGTPQTIPGAPMVIPGQPPIPTQIPNPLYATLSEDLRQLQQELRDLNNQVRTINREVATLRGKPHAYVPTGGTRLQFQNDIRALKLEISNPAVTGAGATGLVEKINHHAGSTVIPDTAFNPKDLKLDKVRLLEVVKVALKK